MPPKAAYIAVYLEVASKKVFASALDWPGWCRAGKDAEAALAALDAYASRYSKVADLARVPLPTSTKFDVVERLTGNATTEFGAPAVAARSDREPLPSTEAGRIAALVGASWKALDEAVRSSPAALRKGPRGGGRDRDKIFEHVLDAEVMYAGKIGVRGLRAPQPHDRPAVLAERSAILEALRAAAGPQVVPEKAWLPRYCARRIAWHVLDHAWEMEDRAPEG